MPPPCSACSGPVPAAPRFPSASGHVAPVPFHPRRPRPRLHRLLAHDVRDPPAPVVSDALRFQAPSLVTVLLVRPFAGLPQLLRPLLTSRSGSHRRPFKRKPRSPQVRSRPFSASSPHLRHLALTTRASRFPARSPCSASPRMRFVFLDSRLRYALPPHDRSPSRSCVSLRSLWSACGRTSTS